MCCGSRAHMLTDLGLRRSTLETRQGSMMNDHHPEGHCPLWLWLRMHVRLLLQISLLS
jgi:hypothetical protein